MPQALLVAILAAAAPLFAMATERFGGLVPCALCLLQRWPYWVAAALALLALALPRGPARRLGLVLAALAVLGSGAVAAVHVGVEQKWWPSPLPECAAPSAGTSSNVDDLLKGMLDKPAKPCDDPTFLIPGLPLSMAGMNLAYALALAGLALGGAIRAGRP
jgi:disulfide bond formation protein DsbB